ncbi:MAG: sugar transferase [Hyphomicrobium sp.]|uniref:sugar transferase n=1 Tax=Hyphomicrobium sp. TaxID=82 RepID=UPI0039E634B6
MSVFSSFGGSTVEQTGGGPVVVSERRSEPRLLDRKFGSKAFLLGLLQSGSGKYSKPIGGHLKRAFDLLVALAAVVALSPLLCLIAVSLRLATGGPVIYRHRRVGYGGRSFDCLKFRTMVTDGDAVLEQYLKDNPLAAEEWRRTRKLTRDPRVTELGYFLRKTSLDELPQLFNILRGDMSCVGPRPVVVEELERYGELAHDYCGARPGVTGLWQISGRSLASYEERVQLDSEYLRKWSFARDISILVRTLPAVLKIEQAA